MTHGVRHSRRAYPRVCTAMSSRVCPRPAPVADRRTCRATSFLSFRSTHPIYHPCWFRRYQIGSDGKLTVTVSPRQAIALHTGAQGMGLPIVEQTQQVSILFSETATTTLGQVSCPSIGFG